MPYCSPSTAQRDPWAISTINPFQHKEGNLQTASPALHHSVSTIPETQTLALQQKNGNAVNPAVTSKSCPAGAS